MQNKSMAFVGLDVSKDSISVSVAEDGCDGEVRDWGNNPTAQGSVDRLLNKLATRFERVEICYEAGLTGYGLYRKIEVFGFCCHVVAPSLVPVRAGERIKTDGRDATRLARLFRAGELTSVWVSDEVHEAMRDLVRSCESAASDQRYKRQQISAFLLRHSRVYHRSKPWTMRYRRWLQRQSFEHPARQIALQEMIMAERHAVKRVARLTAGIEELLPDWQLKPVVDTLQALRGVALIGAVTFIAEIGDVRWFETPRKLMAYLGLVPSEYSTG